MAEGGRCCGDRVRTADVRLVRRRVTFLNAGPTRHRHARGCKAPAVGAEDLVVAVRFDPPGAYDRLRAWRDENAAILGGVSDEQIRIDVGRAVGGDFVRVWLPAEVARQLGVHS